MSGEAEEPEEPTNKIRQAYGRGHGAVMQCCSGYTIRPPHGREGSIDEGLGQSEALALGRENDLANGAISLPWSWVFVCFCRSCRTSERIPHGTT